MKKEKEGGYLRRHVWIVPDLTMRQDIRRLGRYDHLDRVNAALHLQVAEVQATRQFDTAHLVVRHLVLDARHQNVSNVAVLVRYDLLRYLAQW